MKNSFCILHGALAFLCFFTLAAQGFAADGDPAAGPHETTPPPAHENAPPPTHEAAPAAANSGATPPAEGTPIGRPMTTAAHKAQAAESAQALIDYHETVSPLCVAIVTGMRQRMTLEQAAANYARMQKLESDTDQLLARNSNLARLAQTEAKQVEDNLLFSMARGSLGDTLVFVRGKLREMNDAYNKVAALETKLQSIKERDSAEYITTDELFVNASAAFGILYGKYRTIMRTLLSIAKGEGMSMGINIAQVTDGTKDSDFKVVYNLVDPQSISLARSVLRIMDPKIRDVYFNPDATERPWADIPSLASAEYMFRHNIHALLGKLQDDYDVQVQLDSYYKRAMYVFATTILEGGDQKWIPNWVRPWLLRLTLISKDVMMVEKYLSRVQEIVRITERVDAKGNIVRLSTEAAMDLKIKTVMHYDERSDADDFLLTYARMIFQTDDWADLVSAVAQRAKAHEDGNMYALYLKRLQDIQKKAAGMPPLPFLDKPEAVHQLRLLIAQASYAGLGFYLTEHNLYPKLVHLIQQISPHLPL